MRVADRRLGKGLAHKVLREQRLWCGVGSRENQGSAAVDRGNRGSGGRREPAKSEDGEASARPVRPLGTSPARKAETENLCGTGRVAEIALSGLGVKNGDNECRYLHVDDA